MGLCKSKPKKPSVEEERGARRRSTPTISAPSPQTEIPVKDDSRQATTTAAVSTPVKAPGKASGAPPDESSSSNKKPTPSPVKRSDSIDEWANTSHFGPPTPTSPAGKSTPMRISDPIIDIGNLVSSPLKSPELVDTRSISYLDATNTNEGGLSPARRSRNNSTTTGRMSPTASPPRDIDSSPIRTMSPVFLQGHRIEPSSSAEKNSTRVVPPRSSSASSSRPNSVAKSPKGSPARSPQKPSPSSSPTSNGSSPLKPPRGISNRSPSPNNLAGIPEKNGNTNRNDSPTTTAIKTSSSSTSASNKSNTNSSNSRKNGSATKAANTKISTPKAGFKGSPSAKVRAQTAREKHIARQKAIADKRKSDLDKATKKREGNRAKGYGSPRYGQKGPKITKGMTDRERHLARQQFIEEQKLKRKQSTGGHPIENAGNVKVFMKQAKLEVSPKIGRKHPFIRDENQAPGVTTSTPLKTTSLAGGDSVNISNVSEV